jgi:hypothetical protein
MVVADGTTSLQAPAVVAAVQVSFSSGHRF